ncbi:MAG: tRNA (adenosine(37)-N6)-dimethylallyltransferase MiaA [Clostridia bacterium]|nr:tRNA (adenosine(37)-N6)-dimethylallyltransferase MiaA [Clostridia bacterium]
MSIAAEIADEYRRQSGPSAIIICGPTASGKSHLAMELCGLLGGELVSCDSMQIYRMMDIGTAKPSLEDRKKIPHHMIDIVDPWENYSVFKYKESAEIITGDIISRGKVPVFCGGTGLYINTLIDNRTYTDEPEDTYFCEEYRAEKEKCDQLFESGDKVLLHGLLAKYDPEAAAEIHMNNIKRVYRQLVLFFVTGKPRQQRNEESLLHTPKLRYLTYCLLPERDLLYKKINERVDDMREKGLDDEVRMVYAACRNNVSDESVKSLDILKLTALNAIGYKEIIPYLDFPELRELGIPEERWCRDAVYDRIKKDTRRYAKRQITWFKKTPGTVFLSPDI